MNTVVKFIYFDVGGVLLDFREGHSRVSKQYGIPLEKIQEVFEKNWREACRGKLSNIEYMALFVNVLQLKEPFPDVSDFWTDYHVAIPQTHEFIREIAPKYAMGLLTNAEYGAMKYAKQKRLIPDVPWHAIIDSSALGVIKPEPEIYEVAEKAAGVAPEEIFFIDDVEEHITVAKSRGWQGMVFDTNDVEGSIQKLATLLL